MNSSSLKGYLTGLILGDGYIDSGIRKRSFRIKSINEEFSEKVYEDIKSVNTFKLEKKYHPGYTDKYGTTHKPYWETTTKSHPYFAKIYHWFYDDKRKRIITKEALNALTIEGLANWYMCDGYLTKVGKTKGEIYDRRVELCTDRYSRKDVEKIRKYLLEEWGWDTSLIRRKTGKRLFYRVRFKLSSAQDFLYKISPCVPGSFLYKLDMAYTNKPDWMNEEYFALMKKIQQRESLSKS